MAILCGVGLLTAIGWGLTRSVDPADINPPVVVAADALTLSVPERVEAGEGFVVEVGGLEPGVETLTILDAGYGLRKLTAVPIRSSVSVEVPAFDGPASGQVLLTVIQGRRSSNSTIDVEPGPPVDPIDLYLGPRTVVADNEHTVMLVAVPEDEWGNPVAQGTAVDFATTRPDLRVETESHATEGLLAWYEIPSGSVAGRTRVAASSGTAGAPERTFLEVAGTPSSFNLTAVEDLVPADGSALLTIVTDVLVDRFGNTLPDGTVVALDAQGATGFRRIHGQTIDGRAEFTLEVPDEPGTVSLVATASGVRSSPLDLAFSSSVASMKAELELAPEVAIVHIGPVRSVRGSYVPEGTVATVTAADGTVAVADLTLGFGSAFLPPQTDMSRVVVEVLGAKMIVRSNP